MEFKSYCEIDNSYRTKTIHEIVAQGFSGGEWVVEEKIHGSNAQFAFDGTTLLMGKKSGYLTMEDNFYNHKTVYQKYMDNISKLFILIKEENPDVNNIIVYGEIYGGWYPHPDVPKVLNSTKVQKGIYYNPENDFYAFDLKIDGNLVNVDKRNELFDKVGLFYAKPLFRGTFQECLDYSNEYPTTIPGRLGLPEINENVCEGNVIKTVESKFFGCGSRVILKNKNKKWSEKDAIPKQKIEIVLSENGQKALVILQSLISENRLRNVLSHIGSEITNKDFALIMKEMAIDVWKEFEQDNKDAFVGIEKIEEDKIKKVANKLIAEIIRNNFLNIIDKTW